MDSLLSIPCGELALKSVFFSALFLLALFVLRKSGPGIKQVVCLSGTFLLFLLPFGQLLPRVEAEALNHLLPAGSPGQSPVPSTALESGASFPIPWIWIWTAGTALLLLHHGIGLLALRRRRNASVQLPGNLPSACARHIGLAKTPGVWLCPRVASPAVAGPIHPRIYLPEEALRWPAERLRLVLLHEMAHIKRGDLWTQLPGLFACALYWFNPLVWILHRVLCREREFACDSLVVRSGASAEEYAEHLVDIAASRLQLAAAISMAGDPSQLETRVVQLLEGNGRKKGDLLPAGVLALTLLASAALSLGAACLTGKKESALASRHEGQGFAVPPSPDRLPPENPAFSRSGKSAEWTPEEIQRRLAANPFPEEVR